MDINDIIDETGHFPDGYLQQTLWDFVTSDILSNDAAVDMLAKIVVGYRPHKDYDGYWLCEETLQTVRCVVFLNAFYIVHRESSLERRTDELKKILAHEFGHHWTLSHLIKNHNFKYREDRLPTTYYNLRGLNNSTCRAFYVDESVDDWYWHRCDKEIIAEDYKYLFAPPAYGHPHRIVDEAKEFMFMDLDHPDGSVCEFIRTIDRLSSLS